MNIELPDVSDLPCPCCGEKLMAIELRDDWPWLACSLCGIEAEAELG